VPGEPPFALVLVVVLVLERVARSWDVLLPIAWRGVALARARLSREFRLNLDPAEPRESRRLPLITRRRCSSYDPGVNASKVTSECIALGRFHEPLAFTCLGRTSDKNEDCEGGGTQAKAAPLQAAGKSTSHERATLSRTRTRTMDPQFIDSL
jgi:hypothetical protein